MPQIQDHKPALSKPQPRPRPTPFPLEFSHLHIFYFGVHLSCLLLPWYGISLSAVGICLASYFIRSFGLVAGYHRYFAHHAFKTSRPVQFLLALLGTLAGQRGVLWWAQTHRDHHRHADTSEDIHSPHVQGFLYAHSGWFLNKEHREVDLNRVKDWAKFPELVFIDKWNWLLLVLFAITMYALLGASGVLFGFCLSTVMIWHTTHLIQSVSHSYGGYQRFATDDHSRNHIWLGIIALGDGFHNNHHYFPTSAKHGVAWWEIDIAYYILKAMSLLGLVWDLQTIPARSTPERVEH